MKKGAKIAACIAAAIAFLGGAGFYLSQTVIKYKMISYKFPYLLEDSALYKSYPYADTEVPDEFRECSVKGIDFKAPDGLFWMYPDATDDVKSGILVDNDDISKRELLICVMDKEEPVYPDSTGFKALGFFDKRMNKGLKKLGYEPAEYYHDMMFAANTFRLEKCNMFSPSEVNAAYKLMLFKGIMTPASYSVDGVEGSFETTGSSKEIHYYYDNGNMRSFVTESANKNGAYELDLEVYDVNDLNSWQNVMIISKGPEMARQIAKTIDIAEDTE